MKIIESKKQKEEPKEATGAASAGNGITAPAFSMWSDDEEAKEEYKRKPKSKRRVEGEFYEMTDSSSVGAYDANSFQDINMKGNTLKGLGRSWKQTQIPGGSYVEINKKCKTFPYCNQGNTGAVSYKKPKRVKNSPLSEAIYNISLKTGLTEETIKYLIIKSINENL
jgi:hypothetical protein